MNTNLYLNRAIYALTKSELNSVHGDRYEDICWGEDVDNIPSEQEVLALIPIVKEEYAFEVLRKKRNLLLSDSDWTQTQDSKVDKASWSEYRQALRDLPINIENPENVVWPTPPQ